MADNDMSFRQRSVIEFLVKEEIPAAEIHQRLQRAYGSVCMGASSVRRWVKHFKDGNTSIEDEPRSCRPRTASTERNKESVDEIIQDDRLVTVDTIARKFGIGHSAVQEMIESLSYRQVCARDESWFHHFEPETKRQYGMAPFAFSVKKEGKDSAISCEGDEILAVNGEALQGMSHAEAIAAFKRIRSGPVALRLARRHVLR
ncbi:hypothetical protein B7P43_G12353 [Cryptotermes secundus]|uniref:PDZ domain-containing protein n=1 Tax=Cryptotermes secundus TaxID=105785 RepID=A0A2J7R7A9_9NEOP|nr:hypothetical protein B7P43_G12353 [Cryptotermes secundus]